MKKELFLEHLMGLYTRRGFSIISPIGLSQDYSAKFPELESRIDVDEDLLEYEKGVNFIAYDDKQYVLVFVNAMFVDKKKATRTFGDKVIRLKHNEAQMYIKDLEIDIEERTPIFHYIVKDSKLLEKSAWRFKHERPETIKVAIVSDYDEDLKDDLFVIKKEDDTPQLDNEVDDNEVEVGGVANAFSGKTGVKAVGDWSIAEMAKKHHCTESIMQLFLIEHGLLSQKIKDGRKHLAITKKGDRQGFSIKKTKNELYIQVSKNLVAPIDVWSDWILTKVDGKKNAGNAYELFIAEHYENQGYFIKLNGFENGKKDNSVDVIAIKDDEALLIQCKHWSVKYCRENQKYLKKEDIVSFEEDSKKILSNPFYDNKKIKKVFVISYNIANKETIDYCSQKEGIDLELIPFKKAN